MSARAFSIPMPASRDGTLAVPYQARNIPPDAKAPDVILPLDVRREVLKRAGFEKEPTSARKTMNCPK